ncbi:hypothetical protein ACFXB3_32415 [Streptomyces sp. NPDC059447]|uniref:hypothetical protein n=1 Tax=Streptomyces sp. NPDC059447 TaxID=3346834 RepID=UPI0036760060
MPELIAVLLTLLTLPAQAAAAANPALLVRRRRRPRLHPDEAPMVLRVLGAAR